MKFKATVEYSKKIREVSARNKKVGIIAEFLKKLSEKEAVIGVNYISGRVRQGKMNIAWKGLSGLYEVAARKSASQNLVQIDRYLEQSRAASGS